MHRLAVLALLFSPLAAAAQMGAGPIPDSPAATRGNAAGGATMNAIPDNPAATRGDPSGVVRTRVLDIADPIPGEEADVPGAPPARRTDDGQPAAVVAPRVVPVPVGGADAPSEDRAEPVTAAWAPPEEGPDRVELPGRLPPVNVPDTRTRFRDVAARRALVAARGALRDALATEDPAQIAEARRRLERARADMDEAGDDGERAAWLAALAERRAQLRRLRASPREWEAHVAMERRARLTRLLAEGAEEAEALTPAVREELRTHARRMARLARIREVAETSGDEPTIERVDAVVDREVARHAAVLRRLGLSGDLEEAL